MIRAVDAVAVLMAGNATQIVDGATIDIPKALYPHVETNKFLRSSDCFQFHQSHVLLGSDVSVVYILVILNICIL